jgi:Pentapeptide repeats (9 copies)/Pentapeptide repeats (8 copies)
MTGPDDAQNAEQPRRTVRAALPSRFRRWSALLAGGNVVLLMVLTATLAFATPSLLSSTATFAGLAAAVLTAVVGFFGIVVAYAPRWIVEHRVKKLDGPLGPADRMDAENDVRLALIQAISGILLAGGFAITWMQLGQAQDQFHEAQVTSNLQLQQNGTQLQIVRTGQLAERFSRAMEQLGSDSPDVRLGGIYALEGLLVDLGENTSGAQVQTVSATEQAQLSAYQAADRRAVIEILSAYVRNHVAWDPTTPTRSTSITQDLGVRAADVQAVMSVLARHAAQAEPDVHVFLPRTDLRGVRLTCRATDDSDCARLDSADFTGCNLAGADFFAASLKDATLSSANLAGARFGEARLVDAVLLGANLSGVDFNGADLSQASGRSLHSVIRPASRAATLDQADLDGAQLQGALLAGVDLSTVRNLDKANLQDAQTDRSTRWPPGFAWESTGVIIRSA